MILDFLSKRRDARGVGSGIGLSNTKRLKAELAGCYSWQITTLLILVAMSEERPHGVHLGMACGRVSSRPVNLLENYRRLPQPQTRSPIWFGNQASQPTRGRHGLDKFDGVRMLFIAATPVRKREITTKLPNCRTNMTTLEMLHSVQLVSEVESWLIASRIGCVVPSLPSARFV